MTNTPSTDNKWQEFIRKQAVQLWACLKGQTVTERVTAGLAAGAGMLIVMVAIADWQIRRLDVNLIPDSEYHACSGEEKAISCQA